jgi:hypothetical protein
VIEMPADPDYIDILNCYNEAMEKAKKGHQIPTADMYILAVRKHLTSILFPGHNKHYNHRIGNYHQNVGPVARDAPTEEERRRLKLKQAEK